MIVSVAAKFDRVLTIAENEPVVAASLETVEYVSHGDDFDTPPYFEATNKAERDVRHVAEQAVTADGQ